MKISVLEHEKIYFAAKTDIANKRISEKYKSLLFQIEEKQQNKLFKWGRNFVTPQQWVGIIHFSDLTIEILPKIADEIPLEETRGILINMLKVVHDIPVRDKIESEFAFSKNGLLDILVAFFIKELEIQLRKGDFQNIL
ncbi:5-methylcytosine restriction system specificity protein McrC [Bacillus paranthracis]